MKKTIVRRPVLAESVDSLSNIHPILQRIYITRGINDPTQLMLNVQHLLPFTLLKDIDIAAKHLADAVINQKSLLIIGDFDADGATSTAVAVRALRMMGAKNVDYLVPNRFEYGYGLTPEIVEVAESFQPDVLITVDNGIASLDGVKAAKEKNYTIIITDHHLAGSELPDADAIVNPNQPGCSFPSKSIAGVGVIFYVMLALRAALREQDWFKRIQKPEPNLAQLLDLVALGTIADVVSLDHNNRILVHQGLQRIRAGYCCEGIKALAEVANRNLATLGSMDLGFMIGPRLNAAGRLDDMSLGIKGLLTEDKFEARLIAQQLDDLNKERRAIEDSMKHQAFSLLDSIKNDKLGQDIPYGIALFDETWHQGVVGILAARIKEYYHRPTICFTLESEDTLKGSARSIQGLHIRDVLKQIATLHPHIIIKFGGHAMAAGLSIHKKYFIEFQTYFNQQVRAQLNEGALENKLYTDGELHPEDLTLSLAELISQSGPWGQMFPEPLFDGLFEVVERQIIADKHLKMVLKHPEKPIVKEAIAFNADSNVLHQPFDRAHLAYRLNINEFRQKKQLQLIVDYLEPV